MLACRNCGSKCRIRWTPRPEPCFLKGSKAKRPAEVPTFWRCLLSDVSSALHLDQRPSRGRALGATAGAATPARFRLALASAGQLFGLRRDRPLDILEADLFLSSLAARLVLDHDDTNMAAAFELAEQHLVGERLLDVLLDHARHRPRAHVLVITVP